MKVGLAFASSVAIDGATTLEICGRAEAASFESLWCGEHVIIPDEIYSKYPYTEDGKIPAEPDTPIPDPLMWLSFAAAAAPNAAAPDVVSAARPGAVLLPVPLPGCPPLADPVYHPSTAAASPETRGSDAVAGGVGALAGVVGGPAAVVAGHLGKFTITDTSSETVFGNCSFDTRDYYQEEPLQLYASQLDNDGDPCTATCIDISRNKG